MTWLMEGGIKFLLYKETHAKNYLIFCLGDYMIKVQSKGIRVGIMMIDM